MLFVPVPAAVVGAVVAAFVSIGLMGVVITDYNVALLLALMRRLSTPVAGVFGGTKPRSDETAIGAMGDVVV